MSEAPIPTIKIGSTAWMLNPDWVSYRPSSSTQFIKVDEMTDAIFPAYAEARLRAYLDTHALSVGVGTKESAGSIAAINLAIDGRLTDEIPDCMSPVIGRWIITMQDAMPAKMRNSQEWHATLIDAAGSGRDPQHEA